MFLFPSTALDEAPPNPVEDCLVGLRFARLPVRGEIQGLAFHVLFGHNRYNISRCTLRRNVDYGS